MGQDGGTHRRTLCPIPKDDKNGDRELGLAAKQGPDGHGVGNEDLTDGGGETQGVGGNTPSSARAFVAL